LFRIINRKHVDSFITLKSDIEALWAGAFSRIGDMGRSVFLNMAEEIDATRRLLESLGDEVSIRVNIDDITIALDRIDLLHTRIGLLNEERIALHGVDIQEKAQIIGQVLSAAEAEGRFTPQHQAALKTVGIDPVQILGKITGESVEELTQKMQQGAFTVAMLKQALGSASEEGKSFHQVLGGIRDVSSGVKDGLDGLTKIIELTGKFSEAEGSAKLLRTLKNVSGGLDGALKLVSGAEGIVGGVSKLVGVGEAAGGAALVEGAVATAEAVTGFELLTAATVGATEGLGLIGTALLATPWGAAAAGIAALGVGLYEICQIPEKNAEIEKKNKEVEQVEKYNNIVTRTIRDLQWEDIQPMKNEQFFSNAQVPFHETMFQEILEIRLAEGTKEYRDMMMGHIKELYHDLTSDANAVSLVTLGRNEHTDTKENHERWTQLLEFFEKEEAKFAREEKLKSIGKQSKTTKARNISTTASSALTSGGGKQIVIHVKSFAEHFTVNATNLPDAGRQSRDVFERMFLEVLHSANAAM